MRRTISSSSGDSDEFFDAVEHLEDESNGHGEGGKVLTRLSSLGESELEEGSQCSNPRQQEFKETDDMWASAQAFPSHTCSTSLMDAVSSEQESDSASCEEDVGEMAEAALDFTTNDTPDNAENDVGVETPAMGVESTAPTKPIVPPINLAALPPDNSDLFTVPTRDMEEIIERQYTDDEIETLNHLVERLQAAEDARPPAEEEKASPEEGNKCEAAETDVAVNVQKESAPEDDPGYFTPERILDCNTVITDLVRCDVTSPLEALYLMCPKTTNYSFNSKRGRKSMSPKRVDNSPPTRTSVTSDDDVPRGEVTPPPPSDVDHTESVERRLDMDSSDSSDDDSSFSSAGKYRMINKDTGSVHDMRVVMQQIDEAGSSDALDTRYSFLPTKDQLEYQRQSKQSCKADSQETEESVAAASFDDTTVAEDSSPSTRSRKRSGVKFSSKLAKSKMASNVRKGVAGLKSSRQQKRNRKRTTSADMVPSNAIHVRTTSRQKQKRHAGEESEHDIPVDSSFNPMLLIKEIPNSHKGPAWCASFSPSGRFLATGGEDGNVCIWAVSPKSKSLHPNGISTEQDESDTDTDGETEVEEQNASAPPLHFIGTGPELATNLDVLSAEPIQRFNDHTADVIDLSWSHTNFLLSASLDSSVRLYHFSKPGCLHLFKHANLVASVAFHPSNDRYFISGGIDKKLRFWDITSGRVKEWAQAPDVITAARFTPDGKYAVAGLFHGQVLFYDVNGLKYYTQIACRNRSGKHSKGKKVTGISFVNVERDDWVQSKQAKDADMNISTSESRTTLSERLSDSTKDMARRVTSAFRHGAARPEALRYTERMLVTTNDSRVRLYGLSDFQLVRKYKGHRNASMQIRARISESGSHIASGSESGHVFIWDTLAKNRPQKSSIHHKHDKTKSSHHFEASKAPLPIITDSVFFPARSVDEALLSSNNVFPFSLGMDRVDDDMSNAAILTLDYDGCLRVFLRKSCIDNILEAATPRGGTMT